MATRTVAAFALLVSAASAAIVPSLGRHVKWATAGSHYRQSHLVPWATGRGYWTGGRAHGGSHYKALGAAVAVRLGKPLTPRSQHAVAVLDGGFGIMPSVTGVVKFERCPSTGGVQIRGSLQGLPANAALAMHVHEAGDLRGGCVTVGEHWNPYRVPHGPPHEPSHTGDFGNLVTDARGRATFKVTNVLLSTLSVNDLLGRAFVVHERTDDLGYGGRPTSLKDGNAGRRIACGIIGRA